MGPSNRQHGHPATEQETGSLFDGTGWVFAAATRPRKSTGWTADSSPLQEADTRAYGLKLAVDGPDERSVEELRNAEVDWRSGSFDPMEG